MGADLARPGTADSFVILIIFSFWCGMVGSGEAWQGLVMPGVVGLGSARQGKAGHGVRDLRVPDHK